MSLFISLLMIVKFIGCMIIPSTRSPIANADRFEGYGEFLPQKKYLEIPLMAVVNIRGDRLYHEHITWDQGTVLAQLGLLPEYLPFPYPLPDGRKPGPGKSFEYRLPVAGSETAEKVRNKNLVVLNGMFRFGIREV
jgi:carboxymethylenebutenolidase